MHLSLAVVLSMGLLVKPRAVMYKPSSPRGFTFVEVAVVLGVISVLLAGVLRGTELIKWSRINSITAQQKTIQTAFYGFVDRYKILPGDMDSTQVLLINSSAAPAFAAGDGNVLLADSPAFFNNLAQAGFMTCQVCSSNAVITPGAINTAATYIPPAAGLNSANSLLNVYGQAIAFYYDSGITGSSTAGSISFLGDVSDGGKPSLLTGGGITSAMLAEIDRKVDDGSPGTGGFRYTDIVATTTVSGAGIFVNATQSGQCFAGTTIPFTWATNQPGLCQAAFSL
jgi:prepilin-type N-terminal cleavage/methylation domain-containing protein